MKNQTLIELFESDYDEDGDEYIPAPIETLERRVFELLDAELPNMIDLTQLDDVQWDYLYHRLLMGPVYDLQCKYEVIEPGD